MAVDDETSAAEPVDDVADQGDAGDASADDDRTPRTSTGSSSRAGGAVSDGAGWVLGLILWAGVALPFLHGGPAGVKAWWLAKMFNKAPDGSQLP